MADNNGIQTGQVVLVTGAGKGIGRQTAAQLAREGNHVVINYFSSEKAAQKTLDIIVENNGQASLLRFDVTDQDACQKAIKSIIATHGKIDILVNNAGCRADRLLAMMPPNAWQQVMDTNLNGFYNVTKPVVKNMIKNRYGRIVNVTSASGQMGNAGQVNYSASKAGLIGATKALSREVANRNITVNAVAPGFIDTGMLDGLDVDQICQTIPANRIGTPQDVAHAISFLCSPKSGYVTGQVLGVNGGLI